MSRQSKLPTQTSKPDSKKAGSTGPGKQSPTSKRYGASPVQRSTGASGEASSEGVHAAAAQGTSGTATELSFLDRIQTSFGHHDVGNVQQYTDANANAASKAMGAKAYATGNAVAFAGAPDLHTAAHEAAHVVQQRGGVQLKDDVGATGDRYEQHADAVADKVVSGESAETLLDTMAGGATNHGNVQRQVVQRKNPDSEPREERTEEGRVFSVNYQKGDAATGLEPKQEKPVQTFQSEVQKIMGDWRKKRSTPNLTFDDGTLALNRALSKLRREAAEFDGVSTVSNMHPVLANGAQRIHTTTYTRFLQEIRVFNAGAVNDYKHLLGFEDLKVTHKYQAKGGASESGGIEIAGVGGGVETKDVTFYYSCPELGISWNQLVSLNGFKLSYTLSAKSAIGGAKGPKDPTFDPSLGGSSQKAGSSKDPLTLDPTTSYLPPGFFGTARYTQVGASVKGSAGALMGGAVGAAASAMVISNPDRFGVAPTTLTWNSDWAPTSERTASVGPKGPEPGADLAATAEVAEFTASMVGKAELEGDLGEVEDENKAMYVWVPLHLGWVFFNTGEASLTENGYNTLKLLSQEVKDRDDTVEKKLMSVPRYKVEIVGSYSNRWETHDKDIKKLKKKKKRSEKEETELETLRLIKQAENEGLAMDRAREVSASFSDMLPMHSKPGLRAGLPKREGDFVVEGPLENEGEEEFENLGKDRRVEVRVSVLRNLVFGLPPGAKLTK